MSAQTEMPVSMLDPAGSAFVRVPPPPMSIRLPPVLLEHLRVCAEVNCRSLNKEILFRLQESVCGESINEHGVIVRVLPPQKK